MKNPTIFVILSVSLACGALAVNARAVDTQAAKDQPVTLTGCLNGPYDDGAYKIETESEKVMIGATIDVLRENVGKEVRATGQWITVDQGKLDASTREGSQDSQERVFKADKIEEIAASCKEK
jgi:hypothetical protein